MAGDEAGNPSRALAKLRDQSVRIEAAVAYIDVERLRDLVAEDAGKSWLR